jgi:transposase
VFYPTAAVERAMRIQEVILRTISGEMYWFQAAEILGVSVATMRRWKALYERRGYDGLFDRRRKRPSPKRVPYAQVEAVLKLYRERYADFNVRHFHEQLNQEHGIGLSYTWVKTALQTAGLVPRRRRRGPHRKKRERRPLPGMLLHLDASRHLWRVLGSGELDDLLVLMDDANSRVYGACLVREEDTRSVLQILCAGVRKYGVFRALYTDRASHFAWTPTHGEPVDRSRLTQVGRALKQLGIEQILAYSPQARGRSERLFGTWQGRLPQELRLRGISDRAGANAYLRRTFIPWHNRRLTVAPQQPGTAFLPATNRAALEQIFCLEHARVVANDNTVTYGKLHLQIDACPWRFSFARCPVTVREHLDGRISLWYQDRRIGLYNARGRSLKAVNQYGTREVA